MLAACLQFHKMPQIGIIRLTQIKPYRYTPLNNSRSSHNFKFLNRLVDSDLWKRRSFEIGVYARPDISAGLTITSTEGQCAVI